MYLVGKGPVPRYQIPVILGLFQLGIFQQKTKRHLRSFNVGQWKQIAVGGGGGNKSGKENSFRMCISN